MLYHQKTFHCTFWKVLFPKEILRFTIITSKSTRINLYFEQFPTHVLHQLIHYQNQDRFREPQGIRGIPNNVHDLSIC